MTPEEAVSRTLQEMKERPNLRIAAISGPGEPLANEETYRTLQGVRMAIPDIHFCISTNGILLVDHVSKLMELNVETVSVSISTVNPRSAGRIYQWAIIDGKLQKGEEMGRKLIEKQMEGIRLANRAGIRVKANTVLIPSINIDDIDEIAKSLAEVGADLQNIVPLVPNADMKQLSAPTPSELARARHVGSRYITQFRHCRQCRSDVVGIPGEDTVL
jgi:nitrogen fixation protein NifB